MNTHILKSCLLATALSAVALHSAGAESAAKPWWPMTVVKQAPDGAQEVIDYAPLEKASKAHKICALFPHLKDSIWLAINYGLVDAAKRMGVQLNIFEAGGYENLPKQIAQFDDCLAGGYDAIVLGAISEGGLAQKLREADAASIPVVAVLNVISEAKITGRVYPDITQMTKVSAAYAVERMGATEAKVVTFPGPAGSGWAELFNDGFKADVASASNFEVIGERFGDAGVAAQMQLIQDALQAYPEMNVLYGGAPAIEASEGALEIAGRDDILVVPAYENDAVHAMVKDGRIGGFAAQYPVGQARIAMDMAVRALEDKLEMPYVFPQPTVITSEQLKSMDMTATVAAPEGFSAVYAVEAP